MLCKSRLLSIIPIIFYPIIYLLLIFMSNNWKQTGSLCGRGWLTSNEPKRLDKSPDKRLIWSWGIKHKGEFVEYWLSSFGAHYAQRIIPVLVYEGDLVCIIVGENYFMLVFYVIVMVEGDLFVLVILVKEKKIFSLLNLVSLYGFFWTLPQFTVSPF